MTSRLFTDFYIGDINIHLNPVTQCLEYAKAGVEVISVLTDYKYFKGTLKDMKNVRLAIQEQYNNINRPLILRKDFILDKSIKLYFNIIFIVSKWVFILIIIS